MVLTMRDFHDASSDWGCIVQYSSKTDVASEFLSLSTKVPETERVLKSLHQGRHIMSANSDEIRTGGEP